MYGENRINEKVIGVAFDGTGYGTDGKMWGGEFLVADFAGFERRAELRYVPLAGGDAAVREPWRAALGYLIETFLAVPDLPSLGTIPEKERGIFLEMIPRTRTVEISSGGRLFDAVAALLGLCQKVSFEGQAAVQLEAIADPGATAWYSFEILATEPWQIDMRPAVREIVADVKRGEPAGVVSAKFHHTVAAMIVDVCVRMRRADRLNRVCLSGGTFQNDNLLRHSQVPPNEGGLSLGQAVIAAAQA